VLSTGDLAVPLGSELGLLPTNVDAFGDGLGVPLADVRLHQTLRALAHRRLVGHAPWLAARFASAIDDYARGISINPEAIEERVRGIDPSDPAALQAAIDSGVFEPPQTPEQEAAQRRLGALVALVEGWLDDVVGEAGAVMPTAAALRESGQRRRATGGPAEQTFAALVGLELRPRRQRDAAALWAQLRDQRGIEGRDALWDHPDLLPTDDDLEDTTAFLTGGTIDWDELTRAASADQDASDASDDGSDGGSTSSSGDDDSTSR
jgi:putative hydrolase